MAIVAREVAPDDFAVLTVGQVTAGTKSNIIPDHAVIELNIRAYSDSTRTLLIKAMRCGGSRPVARAAGRGLR